MNIADFTGHQPFALIRRTDSDHVMVLRGAVDRVATLADIPLPMAGSPGRTLAIVPYRQVVERGFEAFDDHCPLLCLRSDQVTNIPLDEVLDALPRRRPQIHSAGFDIDDAQYCSIVERVLSEEIGRGEGSNFVIHRTFLATVDGDPLTEALAAFSRLLTQERGTYWTFCVHTGQRTHVGATPERHVSMDQDLVMMNPISGTFRHHEHDSDEEETERLLRFLADQKEINELFMVLDEELKMMASVAHLGGQVIGPYLKEMANLTHTEYFLAGRSRLDPREVLRRTMFAPTVVGSPIENACRVIARHEGRGRGYYGGVLALLDNATGTPSLDAPILIRCAEFMSSGELRVPVGATLVRDSTPSSEVAETYSKARGVLSALGAVECPDHTPPERGHAADPLVSQALSRRNSTLAPFWLHARTGTESTAERLAGLRAAVVDAEDTFTGMLTHQLRVLGLAVTTRSYREDLAVADHDLVIAGPGPGDPRDLTDPKIKIMHDLVRDALTRGQPLLGVCLGHQVLASVLGFPLARKAIPDQGTQRTIDYFGTTARVGFYSTFAAQSPEDSVMTTAGVVSLSRDTTSGEIRAIQGEGFASMQFHPESVLSETGIDLLRVCLERLVTARTCTRGRER